MVKLFAFLRRREGMTFDDFVEHWRDRHGPLIAGHPELSRHVVRYEQHPRHRAGALSGTAGFDGVAVQWFERMEDFAAFVSEPAYAALVGPDEQRFLDLDGVVFLVTDDAHVVIDGGGEPAS